MKITIIIDDTTRHDLLDIHHPRDRMRNLPELQPSLMTAMEMSKAIQQAAKWHAATPAQPRRRAKQRRGT